MLYAAYGSNMNVEQMAQRCPTARPVGVGYIRDYQLEFCRVATIMPRKGFRVPVVLWEITEECEEALDRYEGFPHLYVKHTLPVSSVEWLNPATGDAETHGNTVDAMVYIMTRSVLSAPSESYVNSIREGYRAFRINEGYITKAIKRAMQA